MQVPDSARLTETEADLIYLSCMPDENVNGAVLSAAADKAYPLGVEEGRRLERADNVAWLRAKGRAQALWPYYADQLADELEARE